MQNSFRKILRFNVSYTNFRGITTDRNLDMNALIDFRLNDELIINSVEDQAYKLLSKVSAGSYINYCKLEEGQQHAIRNKK